MSNQDTATPQMADADASPDLATAPRFVWWREALYVVVFYMAYTSIRNQFGSDLVGYQTAFDNAKDIISIERALGLYHEETLQDLFQSSRPFLWFWNVFYGTFHFLVTGFALIWTYRAMPERWRLVRNSFLVMTGLALVGFALYPLLPPRLLPESYGYFDSMAEIGGLWSFDSGAMQKVSNQYAAMPSLHFGWALWCFMVLFPVLQKRWQRVLIALYPLATLFSIIVTGNHYGLDAVGGALVAVLGYLIGRRLTRLRAPRFRVG
jgi:membrane-associated phospholipid phosphatase